MPGETHFFDDIYSRRGKLGSPTDDQTIQAIADRLYTLYERYYEILDQARINQLFGNSARLKESLRGCQNYCDVFARFMEIQTQQMGKQRWGNNTPRDIFNIPEILQCFPNAKIIVCIRDVRGFLLSYKGKWRVTGEEQQDRLRQLYHPVVTTYLWKASMRQITTTKSTVSKGNIITVRYEDVVTDPEQVVRRVCNQIGEEFDACMLEVNSHNSSDPLVGKGIYSSSSERWRTELSPEEIVISQKIGQHALEYYGYKKIDTHASLTKLLAIYASTPWALWRALDANKSWTGPLIPYLARRVESLLRTPGSG